MNSEQLKHTMETQLLLYCVQYHTNPEIVDVLEQHLKEKIDWSYFLEECVYHRLEALSYKVLSKIKTDQIPKEVLTQLKGRYHRTSIINTFKRAKLMELLALFSMHNIAAIPYKGPFIGTVIYGDITLREFSDLDILVKKQDVLKVKELLLSKGYKSEFLFNEKEEAEHLKTSHSYDFLMELNEVKISIEMHWDFAKKVYGIDFPIEELWQQVRPTNFFNNTKVLTLSPEHLLLALSINHGHKDGWNVISKVADIAGVINYYQDNLNWSVLIEQAQKINIEQIVLLGLLLANKLLDTPLPASIIQKITQTPILEALSDQVIILLFSTDKDDKQFGIDKLFLSLTMREKLRDQVPVSALSQNTVSNYAYMLQPNEKDKAFIQLPQYLNFLYPAVRVVRLIRDYGFVKIVTGVGRHFLSIIKLMMKSIIK